MPWSAPALQAAAGSSSSLFSRLPHLFSALPPGWFCWCFLSGRWGSAPRERAWVERDVPEHSESLARQARHLETTSEIARLVTSTADPTAMMNRAVEIVRARFGFYS